MPLAKYSGPWGLKQAAHLLRRATCGVTVPQITTFAGLGNVDTAVNNLLNTTLPDPVLPLDPLTGQEWFTGTTPAASENDELLRYFKGWFIGQMMSHGINTTIAPAYSAREKMVLFLHTHFTAIEAKISDSRALYFQNQLFRMFVRDGATTTPDKNFKELTIKISVDNAMLKLLDGSENVKGSVNENYARELLELYSIGRGLEADNPGGSGQGEYANYTEEDVQAAAKVLSGWIVDEEFETANVDPDTLLPRGTVRGSALNASAHDNSVKTFSAKFGGVTIQPDPLLTNGDTPTLESALDEIRQLVDMLYDQQETARNICRKIYRFFVWAPHDAPTSLQIESNVIEQMALTFTNSGFKLQPVIDELLRSQHFYDAGSGWGDDNFGGIIKSPLDLVLGSLRIFDIPLPDMITQPAEFYEATGEIVERMLALGMDFYNPYDVAGYEAYHQFPIYHRAWITPNSLANRYEFLRILVTPNSGGMFSVNLHDFIRNNPALNAAAPNARQLIVTLAAHFFPMADNLKFENSDSLETLTIPRMVYFRDRFLQGLTTTPEQYWADRWAESSSELPMWLAYLFNAMLQSPEYQLA
jgi:uncharacterized protein (DUF1800 family)